MLIKKSSGTGPNFFCPWNRTFFVRVHHSFWSAIIHEIRVIGFKYFSILGILMFLDEHEHFYRLDLRRGAGPILIYDYNLISSFGFCNFLNKILLMA
jgi:hypothetical protein